MSMSDLVDLKDTPEGGVEFVFDDELIDALGIDVEDGGHTVDVAIEKYIDEDGKMKVEFAIDTNTDLDDSQIEVLREVVGDDNFTSI